VRRAPSRNDAARVLGGLGWFWIRGEVRRIDATYARWRSLSCCWPLGGALPSRAGPPDPLFLALLLAVALHTACYAAVHPMARYSVAVYPCLAPLAARGLARLLYGPGRSAAAP
jgi:hypothetical protein